MRERPAGPAVPKEMPDPSINPDSPTARKAGAGDDGPRRKHAPATRVKPPAPRPRDERGRYQKASRPPGRPKLTAPPEQEARIILAGLANGYYRDDACEIAGVGTSTFAVWMNRPEPGFVEFREQVQRAETTGRTTLWQTAFEGAKKDPELALKVLKQRWPDRYGDTLRIQAIVRREAQVLVIEEVNHLIASIDDPGVRAAVATALSAWSPPELGSGGADPEDGSGSA